MSIIGLITDFGLKDNFVGVIKAVILKINPGARIVDICHEVKPQDIPEAAFLLKGSFQFFPARTVFLAVVDPGVGSKRKKILVKSKNYFFIAPDNGVLSLALKEEPPLEIIEITNEKYFLKPTANTFQARDIFAPIAAYLSKGGRLRDFGKPIESFRALALPSLKLTERELSGEIIYIDRFGNLVSNIDKDTLKDFIKNKKFKIAIKGETINKLSRHYAEGTQQRPLALIDSFDYLEVAINKASARNYLGINKGAKVRVIRGGS